MSGGSGRQLKKPRDLRPAIFGVVLPNAPPPSIVQAALLAGTAILFERGRAFLA